MLKKQENKNWSKYLNIFQCFGFLLTGELYKQFIHAMAVPVSDKYWIAKVTKKKPEAKSNRSRYEAQRGKHNILDKKKQIK